MRQYQNDPAGFSVYRKKLIIKLMPLMVLGLIVGVAISYFSDNSAKINLISSLIILLVFTAVFALGIFKAIRQQKVLYDDYLLTIADDYISCRKSALLTTIIPFTDIKQISENKQGDLIIKGTLSTQNIVISPGLQYYQQIKNELNAISPIVTDNHHAVLRKYPLVIPLITLALMAAVYISNNKLIILICGSILTALMFWSFYKIRTAVGTDASLRRKAWWILLIIVAIIANVYYKVFSSS